MEWIRQFTLGNEQATIRFGQSLASFCRCGDIFALWGGLGCGKTVLARSMIRALISPDIEVPSPTFTLVQSYGPVTHLGCQVHHLDLFRLVHSEEAYELAIEDALTDGIALIEWPDRLGSLLPLTRLDIHIAFGPVDQSRSVLLGGIHWRERLAEADLG